MGIRCKGSSRRYMCLICVNLKGCTYKCDSPRPGLSSVSSCVVTGVYTLTAPSKLILGGSGLRKSICLPCREILVIILSWMLTLNLGMECSGDKVVERSVSRSVEGKPGEELVTWRDQIYFNVVSNAGSGLEKLVCSDSEMDTRFQESSQAFVYKVKGELIWVESILLLAWQGGWAGSFFWMVARNRKLQNDTFGIHKRPGGLTNFKDTTVFVRWGASIRLPSGEFIDG